MRFPYPSGGGIEEKVIKCLHEAQLTVSSNRVRVPSTEIFIFQVVEDICAKGINCVSSLKL